MKQFWEHQSLELLGEKEAKWFITEAYALSPADYLFLKKKYPALWINLCGRFVSNAVSEELETYLMLTNPESEEHSQVLFASEEAINMASFDSNASVREESIKSGKLYPRRVHDLLHSDSINQDIRSQLLTSAIHAEDSNLIGEIWEYFDALDETSKLDYSSLANAKQTPLHVLQALYTRYYADHMTKKDILANPTLHAEPDWVAERVNIFYNSKNQHPTFEDRFIWSTPYSLLEIWHQTHNLRVLASVHFADVDTLVNAYRDPENVPNRGILLANPHFPLQLVEKSAQSVDEIYWALLREDLPSDAKRRMRTQQSPEQQLILDRKLIRRELHQLHGIDIGQEVYNDIADQYLSMSILDAQELDALNNTIIEFLYSSPHLTSQILEQVEEFAKRHEHIDPGMISEIAHKVNTLAYQYPERNEYVLRALDKMNETDGSIAQTVISREFDCSLITPSIQKKLITFLMSENLSP